MHHAFPRAWAHGQPKAPLQDVSTASKAQTTHLRGHPRILWDPQTKGDKIRSAYLTPAFSGAKTGRDSYVTPAFSGVPKQWGTTSEVVLHPCLLGGPKEGGNATSPPHSRGSPTPSARSKIRRGYLTRAFSAVPKQKGTKSEGPRKRAKIKSGYITPTFLGFPIAGRREQETKWCLFSMQERCLSTEPFSNPPPRFGGLY